MKEKEGDYMKRQKLIIGVVVLILLGCAAFLFRNDTEESEEIFQIPVNNGELLTSSKEGYNSVKIYKQEKQLVVNAESEAAFFDGVQFTVETTGEITPENVEVIWMTIGGGTERTADNDRIIAEVKISDNGELICDTKINFAKKAFDALEDVLERTAD